MLTCNASAFLYKFRNQQFINVVGIGTQQLVNAGRSEIKGLEIEAALRPAEGLSFTAGLGLLDSEYKALLLTGVDPSGNELLEAPNRPPTLAAASRLSLGAEGSLRVIADTPHATHTNFQPPNH